MNSWENKKPVLNGVRMTSTWKVLAATMAWA